MTKLQCYKVYKASKFEKFLSKFIPYYFPFLSKRKRVKIRKYWRNRWKSRLNNDLIKALPKNSLLPPSEKIYWDEWEWEIIIN